jgi:hypothetical protein
VGIFYVERLTRRRRFLWPPNEKEREKERGRERERDGGREGGTRATVLGDPAAP